MAPTQDRIDRRTALRLAGGAGLVGLAGCTGGGGNGGGGGGGGGGGSGTVKIGLQADMTGALSTYGFWFDRVLNGYVEELNANDGIGGMDVELAVEDTGTDSKQGATAFRKLVQQEAVDFVVGSFSSGVNIATNPLAKQLGTPYLPSGSAPSTTGADGNRWVVRTAHEIKQNASLGVDWGVNNHGTNWTVIYQDYAFGQQWLAAIKQFLEGRGQVVQEIPVPIGATDLNSYLNKVPENTDVLFSALILPSSLNFLRQSQDLNVPGARLGDISSIEGVKISEIQEAGQGATFITGLPPSLDTEANAHLQEVGTVESANRNLVRQYWVAYEALSFIKEAVEASGWQSADDHQAFVEWFEGGPSVEEGTAYPQGAKFIRGADHQAFMDRYLTRIEGPDLNVVTKLELDEPPMAASVDYREQSF